MMSSRKEQRAAVHPNKVWQKRGSLEQHVVAVDEEQQREVEEVKAEPAEFFKKVLGFEPFNY